MFERVLQDVARCESGKRGEKQQQKRTCWYHHDQATRGPSLPQRRRVGSEVCIVSSRRFLARCRGWRLREQRQDLGVWFVLVEAKHDERVVVVEALVAEQQDKPVLRPLEGIINQSAVAIIDWVL